MMMKGLQALIRALEENPNRVPAGSPAGGQFAKGGGGNIGGRDSVFAGLQHKLGKDNVLKGKDSGFFIKGKGSISLAAARKLVGIEAPKRDVKAKMLPWGDYATIAAMSGRFKG